MPDTNPPKRRPIDLSPADEARVAAGYEAFKIEYYHNDRNEEISVKAAIMAALNWGKP
jgi:hypothetical protein